MTSHLVRMWAFEQVQELLRSGEAKGWSQAVRTASNYQLVTTVSGAVVLENDAQYTQNDLDPADPASVPTIPEPETWLMFGIIAASLSVMAWRKRKRVAIEC